MRFWQTDAAMVARPLLLAGIVLAMLFIPTRIIRDGAEQEVAARRRDEAQSAPIQRASSIGLAPGGSAGLPPGSTGFGLTFGVMAQEAGASGDVVHMSCHAEPRPVDQPHQSSCNAYRGDTSCRAALPVLCFLPGGVQAPTGVRNVVGQSWTGGTLAATEPVRGAALESLAAGSARCAAELGTGWRMAELQEGGGVLGYQGQRGTGIRPQSRYWVNSGGQQGNCWDGASRFPGVAS